MTTTEPLECLATREGLEIREGPRWSVLQLDGSVALGLLQAAAGIVSMAPASDGRARALEILGEGGEKAVDLSVAVVRRRLRGSAIHGQDPRGS